MGSKITEPLGSIFEPLTDLKLLKENKDSLLDTIAKMTNAGYNPATDAIGLVQTQSGHVPVVYDFDSLVRRRSRYVLSETMAFRLATWVHHLHLATGIPKLEILRDLKKRISHPDGKKALKIVPELKEVKL